MQGIQVIGAHGVTSVDDGGRSGIGAARLPLLLVGQGQDPQGQDLVDLGGVEHVALALGGYGGMVVEDDR